ncbi:cholesterol 25-hydroxylase [Periophthalmus magnuspinnatus]|uniref:cholesterol 25-hydroxylase n=1 Tax=Periophthalmus magnuspinnatus TaxID=409849 RepID=UPI002436784B|nr:cholesterol 25-hydroxylase [Periophthalmus magnuspinnatus]
MTLIKVNFITTDTGLYRRCSEAVMIAPTPAHGQCLLQGLWDFVRAGQEEILLSYYLPACSAFITHVLLCVPFFIMDLLLCVSPQIRSWRIAPDSAPVPSARCWMECLGRLALRYLTVVLPATVLLKCALKTPVLPERAPSCYQLWVEVLACFLLFDALFFAWHFSMHRFPWLYRHVHREHHKNKALIALAAQDASGAELLSLLFLALISTWLVGCHPLSEALFHLLNSWLAIEDHCGYNLPWGLHRLFPSFGLGGAPFHQLHHTKLSGNYAPYFTHWDLLFRTYRE